MTNNLAFARSGWSVLVVAEVIQTYHICSFISLPLLPAEESKISQLSWEQGKHFIVSLLQVIFFFQEAFYTNQIKIFLLYSQCQSKNSDLLLEFPVKLLCPQAVAKWAQVAAVGTPESEVLH